MHASDRYAKVTREKREILLHVDLRRSTCFAKVAPSSGGFFDKFCLPVGQGRRSLLAVRPSASVQNPDPARCPVAGGRQRAFVTL